MRVSGWVEYNRGVIDTAWEAERKLEVGQYEWRHLSNLEDIYLNTACH
jgi:hypothetical protein